MCTIIFTTQTNSINYKQLRMANVLWFKLNIVLNFIIITIILTLNGNNFLKPIGPKLTGNLI